MAGSRISVAMCTFQGERYLATQLQTILEQERPPDEVLISDDGSSDGTMAMLEAFAAQAPFPVDIVRQAARLGVTANFESVLGRCTGDVIVLCDQDDQWVPSRLARIEATFAAAPGAAMVFGDAELIDHRGRSIGMRLWEAIDLGERRRSKLRQDPLGFVLGRSAVTGCTLAIRSTAVPFLVPFPRERGASDRGVIHDWWIGLVLAAVYEPESLVLLEEPLVRYRLHDAQRVGIPNLWLRRWLPAPLLRLRSAAVPLSVHAARLGDVIASIEQVIERLGGEDARSWRLRDAADHLLARSTLAPSRRARIEVIRREVREGRYHAHSTGYAAVLADLVRTA